MPTARRSPLTAKTRALPACVAALGPLLKSRKLTVAEVVGGQAQESGLTPDELNASNDG